MHTATEQSSVGITGLKYCLRQASCLCEELGVVPQEAFSDISLLIMYEVWDESEWGLGIIKHSKVCPHIKHYIALGA